MAHPSTRLRSIFSSSSQTIDWMTGAAAIRGTTEEKIVKCSIVSGVPGPLFILDKVKVFEDTSGVDNKYTIVQFTGEYKGGAAEGGRRPSIWNIFEQRSTPAPCSSFTTCSGPGFLPVVF
uniref:Uncharacterized protein n=1 Tax=Oryza meridionalis TaxID=40149 RepID=A0A0E0DTA3_9ORYZ